MAVQIYGTKVGMTRLFHGDDAVPVTVIEVLPNEVIEVKTKEKHGYCALKVAVGKKRRKGLKAMTGEYKKADVAMRLHMREIPVIDGVAVGGKVTAAVLDPKAMVDVSGIVKGRGFAGVMKRHNFSGHKATHGTCKHRGPGSIGCRMDPGKVFKNKRMAGHWGGNEQITVKNLPIINIDAEKNVVVVRGAIPGPNGGLVAIKQG
jgi:large subunit ribosomal protein L3